MTALEFPFSWTEMTSDELATFEGLLGKRVIKIGDVHWRQVRPGFFRPLVQYKEYAADMVSFPLLARFGAAQYAVSETGSANSFLNCLLFEEAPAYSAATLEPSLSRQVRQAAKLFVIRPVTDLAEFKHQAHRAYLSFLERTQYEYGTKRRDPAYFSAWADALFQLPKILVLGGYFRGELVGISLSFLFEDTVNYATFFCATEAMKTYLPGLMLHAVRVAASRCPQARQVFAGMYKGNRGLDRFYMLRGAQCVRKPALLRINPMTKSLLRFAAPKMYATMLGQIDEETGSAG